VSTNWKWGVVTTGLPGGDDLGQPTGSSTEVTNIVFLKSHRPHKLLVTVNFLRLISLERRFQIQILLHA